MCEKVKKSRRRLRPPKHDDEWKPDVRSSRRKVARAGSPVVLPFSPNHCDLLKLLAVANVMSNNTKRGRLLEKSQIYGLKQRKLTGLQNFEEEMKKQENEVLSSDVKTAVTQTEMLTSKPQKDLQLKWMQQNRK
ncbi:uncharacterized protein LOC134191771 [Corticium candelabrum]|uniref:uncharacterized protein LOC134191771 n=1 Tax=Corticium candelabrum TaxID=121492 RepID=UPI002E276FA4|nr:uncharacterized protein LOC134191771 [Corticium candelabrum]